MTTQEQKRKRREYMRKYMRERAGSHANARENSLKNRYKRSKSENRDHDLRKLYGLEVEVYLEMFAKQGSVCKICRRPKLVGEREFHVDHDHSTGEIRGILCSHCNVGLGYFKNDATRLRIAAEYIEGFVPKQQKFDL
jgi:hypothetical protein